MVPRLMATMSRLDVEGYDAVVGSGGRCRAIPTHELGRICL